jgi:hypothetical protein
MEDTMSVKIATQPLTTFEKAIPAPVLFTLDILRVSLCIVAPVLFFHLGENLACVAGGAFAGEILGATVILDLVLGIFWLARLRRWGTRLSNWCLSETPFRFYGRDTRA